MSDRIPHRKKKNIRLQCLVDLETRDKIFTKIGGRDMSDYLRELIENDVRDVQLEEVVDPRQERLAL